MNIIPKTIRKRINNSLLKFGTVYHKYIPLNDIFRILESEGYEVVQEDGEPWQGLLSGREGKVNLDIARISDDRIVGHFLVLTWYRLESGNYEVTTYVS